MSEPWLRHHVCADSAALARAVADRIAARGAAAIEAHGKFSVVLAGGSTPRRLYGELAAHADAEWPKWHVFFSDERCLPRGDPDRNDTMARAALLDHVPIPARQIHAIEAERGAVQGARAYCAALAGVGPFDVVLLGLGADGHTASLFPGRPLGAEPDAPDALAVHDAPKPPRERVSLGAARLSRANAVFVLVEGPAKRAAVRALGSDAPGPLSSVRPAAGVDLFLDRAAAESSERGPAPR